jgi:GR25 family glycosyltransferase involved in LPS biosynthesis
MTARTLPINAYIIHLERAVERRDQVAAIARALPGTAEIVPAVDGKDLPKDIVDKIYRQRLFKPHYPFALKPGEIGCFLSHRRCWQKIVDSGDNGALIIEDDVEVDAAMLEKAVDLIARHCPKSSYIRFPNKSGRENGVMVAKEADIRLIRPDTPGLGTVGQYIGYEAAKALLEITEIFDRPIDSFLQLLKVHRVPVLTITPSIVREVSSSIGRSYIQKTGSSFGEKLHREVMRPVYRLKVKLANKTRG